MVSKYPLLTEPSGVNFLKSILKSKPLDVDCPKCNRATEQHRTIQIQQTSSTTAQYCGPSVRGGKVRFINLLSADLLGPGPWPIHFRDDLPPLRLRDISAEFCFPCPVDLISFTQLQGTTDPVSGNGMEPSPRLVTWVPGQPKSGTR